MKRRNFLKGMGVLMGMAYVNPVALIPDIVVKGNAFLSPDVMAAEAIALLKDNLTIPNYTLGKGTIHFLPKDHIYDNKEFIELGKEITFRGNIREWKGEIECH